MTFYNSLTAEQRLQKAVVAIMAHKRYVGLSGVMLVGNRTVRDDIPTACTDGKNEFYGRAFVESLNDAELRFLILHEVFHKIYRHLLNLQNLFKIDPALANMACDHALNTQLVEENKTDKFATMTGPLAQGCYDVKYIGWDSVRIFHDLRKNGQGQGQPGQGQPGQGQPGEGSFDEHLWEEAQAMSDEERTQLARDIDAAIRQGALTAGRMGTGDARTFDDLLEPQRDWRDDLREFVSATTTGHDYSTWRKVNRRYVSAGMYMPSGVSETIGEIVVAPDMSGSIGELEVQRMLSEVKSIAETVKPEAVRLLYWDTEICADERYEQQELDTMVTSTKPKGGGGTMVECVPAYMHKKQITAQCAIVFTDGYLGGSWGQWTCPVLWVIVDNPNAAPPFGTVIHVRTHNI